MGQESADTFTSESYFSRLTTSVTNTIPLVPSEKISQPEEPLILKEADMPQEFRECHIFSGYRPVGLNMRQCLRSFFYMHNETVNMWTHLLPGVYYLWCLTQALYTHGSLLTRKEMRLDAVEQVAGVCPFCIFVFSAALYSLMSAMAHTFQVVSTYSRHVCFLLDYAMLSFYAHGAGILFFAHSYCPPTSMLNTMFLPLSAVICILSTFMTAATRLLPFTLQTRQFIRAVIFAAPGFFSSLPMFHRIFSCSQGLEKAMERGLDYEGACQGNAALYWNGHFVLILLSGLFYVSHVPECLWPGGFDNYGHSHQILHVLGGLATYTIIQGAKADKAHWGVANLHGISQRGARDVHQLPEALRMAYYTCSAVLVCNFVLVAFFAWSLREDAPQEGDKETSRDLHTE